ncbi:MAG: hypothetical protein QOE00_176 [Ilumatobacteraceae bacterium]
MKRIVAVALLLGSCGSAKASPTGDSPTLPRTKSITTQSSATIESTSSLPPVVDKTAGFPPRLALTTKDGQVVTFAPHSEPVVTAAVVAPTGEVAVAATVTGGATTIEWHDLANDAVTASVTITGDFHPTAVAQDGKLVALISSAATATTVVLVTPADGELRRWTFDSVLVPEAFANAFSPDSGGLPMGVFVIEYLAQHTYRVRVIDAATGQLGLPLNLRDKGQTVDEVMTAVSRTAVFDPDRQLLFTLYQDASEGGENVGSFIHTLGLIDGVWCLDVPTALGLADHPGALAVSPDGSRLYAASSIGGVAGYVVDDITNGELAMPQARRTTALHASSYHVAIAASNDEVVVALGGELFRLDPVTLAVRDSFTWDMDVEALTVLNDGSIVIVGTGRMTLVSPHDQIVAERGLPALTSEVTRVAVVG